MIGWAIEALIASSMLMLLALALRHPVRRLFGAELAYALWALPVLRLLLPPLPGAWEWSRLFAPTIDRLATSGVVAGAMNPAALPTTIAGPVVTVTVHAAGGSLPIAVVPPTATPIGAPIALLLGGIWLIGAITFIAVHFYQHSRFCRRILTRATPRLAAGAVRVIETDAADGPLAFGVWRKYVAFPRDFDARYDADERALALAHELGHHARGDLIANWAALVVLALHWFNPIAWYAFRAFRADQEMACDARVLAGRDPASRHAYGRAIVKSAKGPDLGGAVSAACHLHTINDLKGRLKMLSKDKKPRMRVMAGVASVTMVAIASLGVTASGTRAADRLRDRVNQATGIDIKTLDARMAAAPFAALASGTGEDRPAAAAQAPKVVPVPPSTATPPVAPPPPAPTIYIERQTAPTPPAPPAPPTPVAGMDNETSFVTTITPDGKRVQKRVVILRKHDGKPMEQGWKTMADIPEVSSVKCPDDGNPHQTVINGNKDGKRTIVICTNRIEKLTRDAAQMAANSKDIERNAYRQALTGLRNARNDMAAKGNAEGLKAIDEAIAEVEADLAKVE